MRTKLSTVSNLMLLFYRSMACAVYLRKVIAFTVIFHITCISHYKSIKSIDDNLYKETIDTKSKQNCKLRTRYTAKGRRVQHFCNISYYRIKDGFNTFTSQECSQRRKEGAKDSFQGLAKGYVSIATLKQKNFPLKQIPNYQFCA